MTLEPRHRHGRVIEDDARVAPVDGVAADVDAGPFAMWTALVIPRRAFGGRAAACEPLRARAPVRPRRRHLSPSCHARALVAESEPRKTGARGVPVAVVRGRGGTDAGRPVARVVVGPLGELFRTLGGVDLAFIGVVASSAARPAGSLVALFRARRRSPIRLLFVRSIPPRSGPPGTSRPEGGPASHRVTFESLRPPTCAECRVQHTGQEAYSYLIL